MSILRLQIFNERFVSENRAKHSLGYVQVV